MPILPAAVLTDFATRLFEAVEVPESDALIVASSLVGATPRARLLRGDADCRSTLIYSSTVGSSNRRGSDRRTRDPRSSSATASGAWDRCRHTVCSTAWYQRRRRASAFADQRVFSVVFEALGRLGEYAERAVDEGVVLIATVNNDGAGRKWRLRHSTPAQHEPALRRCSGIHSFWCSIRAPVSPRKARYCRIFYYITGKKPVPQGWLLDHEGQRRLTRQCSTSSPWGAS